MNKVKSLKNTTEQSTKPWSGITIPEGYTITNDGVSKSSGEHRGEHISGPVWVSAHTSDSSGGNFGHVICWLDRKGKVRTDAFSASVLHEQSGSIIQILADKGLMIRPGKERDLRAYLGSFGNDVEWMRAATQLGWLDSQNGELEYVVATEEKIISRNASESIIFQPEEHSPTTNTMIVQGTLEVWKENIAKPCKNNPYMVFALSLAFAGPLLKPAKVENGGFHFFGRSSRGKTTLAQISASVFGCGVDPSEASERSYVQRWNTTVNALEGLLAAHNDGLLILDEIHTCDAKDFGKVVYDLASGKGKAAMNRRRRLTTQRTWRALVLSTGEISSQRKIEENNRNSHTGQLLRLLDIPTNDDIVSDTKGESPGDFVLKLKRNCGQYFGSAGPAFIREIVTRYENAYDFAAKVKTLLEHYNHELTPDDALPEQTRAMRRFSLVATAGHLAVDFNILPFTHNEVLQAVLTVSRAWLNGSSYLPDQIRGAQSVQHFIQANPGRFRNAKIELHQSGFEKDIAGYHDREKGLYLFLPDGFQEACVGHEPTDVAHELSNRGLLMGGEKDRLSSRRYVLINGRKERITVYAVSESIIGYDFIHPDTNETERDERDSLDITF